MQRTLGKGTRIFIIEGYHTVQIRKIIILTIQGSVYKKPECIVYRGTSNMVKLVHTLKKENNILCLIL